MSARGLQTGVVYFTGAGSLFTSTYYDDHGRTLQTIDYNFTGGFDYTTNQYDFSGKLLETYLQHQKGGLNTQTHHIKTKMNYDGAGRLTSVYKNLDYASSDQLIDSMQYNELGQLRTKYLGKNLDSLIYDYNIRGWLTGINKQYVGSTSTTPTNYFGMELAYDKTTSVTGTTSFLNPIYNGNIAGTVWKSAGDGVARKYDFTYDNVNRLTGAAFLQNTPGVGWENSKIDFTVKGLGYDPNGNILSMTQNGFMIGSSGAIDNLVYTYQANSNKLLQVYDSANVQTSQLGDFHYNPSTKSATDYAYDGNGNLTLDNNKTIGSITYNYLNLPTQIIFQTKGSISYMYDPMGNKLSKTTVDNTVTPSKTTVTKYVAGFEYIQDTLQFMGHEEGRARWAFHKYLNGSTAYGWEYDFFEKDHLGNTRVLLSQEKDSALYVATMDSRNRNTENQLFYNLPATSYARASVPGYPNDTTYGSPNDSVARLNPANGQKVGPAIILKVMSGDMVDLGVQYYYNNITDTNRSTLSASDVLLSLATGVATLSGGAHGTFSALNSTTGPLAPAVNSFMGSNGPQLTGKPTAYLNWMLLDNQFNYVASSSGALPVGAAGVQGNGLLQVPLAQTGISMAKSGYLYIYVSNATPGWDVFFDNLSVKTYSGPLVEEDHYYPFGLTMAGISDKALKTNYAENKFRFNKGSELQNQEFSDGSGLEMYETHFRELDPQLGRWWQIDSKPNENASPYSSMGNNPILTNDPLGDTLDFPGGTPKFKAQFEAAAKFLRRHKVGGLLSEASKMKGIVHVKITNQVSNFDPLTMTLNWNPTGGISTDNSILSPATLLNHELDHAIAYAENPSAYKKRILTTDKNYENKEEERVIKGTEQRTAHALGETPSDFSTRLNHNGKPFAVMDPTSTKSPDEIESTHTTHQVNINEYNKKMLKEKLNKHE